MFENLFARSYLLGGTAYSRINMVRWDLDGRHVWNTVWVVAHLILGLVNRISSVPFKLALWLCGLGG